MNMLTAALVPGILTAVALTGLLRGVDVYQAMLRGAGEGLQVLLRILPNLICLMAAIAMLRASGFLDWAASAAGPLLLRLGIPPQTIALLLIRPLSGSGALGVGSELMQTYGPDSLIGRTAAVMLGSTETTFYTIAVYCSAAGIHDTRYAVPAALLADAAGFLAAAWAVRLLLP